MTKIEPRFSLLIACFVLSGFAGLIYQTVWTQQLALVFGTSELALATVLAAYMAGLALGAAAAGRWAPRVRRPILLYALLELGIGGAALLVPAMIGVASRLQVVLLGGVEMPQASAGSGLFYLVSSFLILLVPTGLMGATLPLLARHAVREPRQIGERVGVLYAANTAGAAAGTLTAAYLLLPRLGLGPTTPPTLPGPAPECSPGTPPAPSPVPWAPATWRCQHGSSPPPRRPPPPAACSWPWPPH